MAEIKDAENKRQHLICNGCCYKNPFCKIIEINDDSISEKVIGEAEEHLSLIDYDRENGKWMKVRFNCIIQFYCAFKGLDIPSHETTCLPYMGRVGEETQQQYPPEDLKCQR